MEKFNKFTENLMKVILVPDETSDSVEEVTPEPPDMFSKTATDFMDDMNPESSSCGCGDEEEDDECGMGEYSDSEDESDAAVNYDTNGLKVSFNGLDITIPNDVVEKIKEVLDSGSDDDEEEDDDDDDEWSNASGSNSDLGEDDDDDDDEEIQEGDRLLKVAGWIAMFNGKKMEIQKSEADGIYGAKQLAIKKWNIPKSKQGLLAVEPAYDD